MSLGGTWLADDGCDHGQAERSAELEGWRSVSRTPGPARRRQSLLVACESQAAKARPKPMPRKIMVRSMKPT